jgi:hypothetical protein
MKVGKKKTEYFYILGYQMELIRKVWLFGKKKNSFKIWRIWVFFFPLKNPLYRSKLYFSGQNLAEKNL